LRLELSVEGENARYQAWATFEDDGWTPVGVRRYAADTDEGADGDWESLGEVTEVSAGDVSRDDDSAEDAP